MTSRKRADILLVERGLFESRAKAQAAIAAGLVTAGGVTLRKASDGVALDAELKATPAHPWVSRGGVKLEAALDHFGFDPAGRVCLDVGASTGGFTAGAARARRAAGLSRSMSGARNCTRACARIDASPRSRRPTSATLDPASLPQAPDFATVDVSFISLRLVLPALDPLLRRPAHLIALIKPQFEAGRAHLKKGIVRDPAVHAAVCEEIAAFAASLGWDVAGIIPSPIDRRRRQRRVPARGTARLTHHCGECVRPQNRHFLRWRA